MCTLAPDFDFLGLLLSLAFILLVEVLRVDPGLLFVIPAFFAVLFGLLANKKRFPGLCRRCSHLLNLIDGC